MGAWFCPAPVLLFEIPKGERSLHSPLSSYDLTKASLMGFKEDNFESEGRKSMRRYTLNRCILLYTHTGTHMTLHDDGDGKDSSTTASMNNEPAAAANEGPLSSADLEDFIRDGYIILKRAFDPVVAAACRDEIWRVMEEETRTRTRTGTSQSNGAKGAIRTTTTSTPISLSSTAFSTSTAAPPPSPGGISRHDPSTWPIKFPLARIYHSEDGPPWSHVFTPRLRKAVDQLCGCAGSWESFGCGWWMITFPRGSSEQEKEEEKEGSATSSESSTSTKNARPPSSSSSSSSSSFYPPPPWRLDGHWHIDGQNRHRCMHTQQVGLVPIFLFSSVEKGGGGTALCEGSHKYIARLLKEAGPDGMDAVEVIKKGQAWVEGGGEGGREGGEGRVVETVGEAGDVMFTHPFLLHGRSANCAEVPKEGGREGGREEGVRFMCHPSVSLTKVPWVGGREGGREGGMSVVERAIVAGWEGEVFSHEECLAAAARWEERKGRGRAYGGERRQKFPEEKEEGGGEDEGEDKEELEEVLPEGVDADVMAVMGMTGFGSGGGKKRRQR